MRRKRALQQRGQARRSTAERCKTEHSHEHEHRRHQHLCERHTGQAGSHADGKVRYINGGRPAGGLGAADGQRGRLSKIRDNQCTRRHAGNASSEVANAAKASTRREVVPAKTSHWGQPNPRRACSTVYAPRSHRSVAQWRIFNIEIKTKRERALPSLHDEGACISCALVIM